jgi:hypothetical protein
MFNSGKTRLIGYCRRFRRLQPLFLLSGAGLLCSPQPLVASNVAEQPTVIVVVGAPGEDEYAGKFSEWSQLLEKAARQGSARPIVIGVKTNEPVTDLQLLQKTLLDEPKEGPGELWLVLIGHGTFDGKEAKFNLRSNDVSVAELAKLLQPFRRPVAVINAASASGPFLNKLTGTNRVVITATRSGSEINYTRFGQYFAKAIADPEADLDKDGQTSLLEAFLMASRQVKDFYDSEGRLATEHSLLDDTGDGMGTPPDWFRGTRAVKSAKDGALLDGFRAHQLHLIRSEAERKLAPEVRARRDLLEVAIAKLRETKRALPEEEYYRQLEPLLLEVARLYERAEKAP